MRIRPGYIQHIQILLIIALGAEILLFSGLWQRRGFVPEVQAQEELPFCNSLEARILSPGDNLEIVNTDTAHTVFCLQPGIYEPFELSRDCSKDKPCYIRPVDSGRAPWEKNENERANISAVNLDSEKRTNITGSWWNIVGITFDDRGQYAQVSVNEGSSHITFDTVLFQNGISMLRFSGGMYHTLKNSVLRNSYRRPGADSHCVFIQRSKYTKIVNNQIYNCAGDGIQIHAGPDNTNSPDGTVIENNEIYITSDLYADCSDSDPDSSLNPLGNCACAENAIDIKATTTKSADAIRYQDITKIKNNIMYGFRKTHSTCGGSGGHGAAVVFNDHPYVRYILFENNVIYNSIAGIYVVGATNATIRNNLFYNIYDQREGESMYVFNCVYGHNNEIYHNTIVGTGYADYYLRHSEEAFYYDIRNNLFVLSGEEKGRDRDTSRFGDTNYVGYNGFFETEKYSNILSPLTNVVGSLSEANLGGSYCFTINKHTNPQQYCIYNVLPTADSPFVDRGDPEVGSRPDIGVDDAVGVLTDLRGYKRDSQPDIGAFEYEGTTSIPGDLDGDGDVDIFDLVIVGNCFGLEATGDCERADANNSGGTIDIFDLVMVGSHFGERG